MLYVSDKFELEVKNLKKVTSLFAVIMVIAVMAACSTPSSTESEVQENSISTAEPVQAESSIPLESSVPDASSGEEETSPEVAVSLLDWNGTWNNFANYFDNPGLEIAYQTLSEREENTPEEVKTHYKEGDTYKCEIAAMAIDGDTITVYTQAQEAEGDGDNIEFSAAYTYTGQMEDANDRSWAHFETTEDVPQTHFLMLPAEADDPGKTMMHFHFRYGIDPNEMIAQDGWYATMIAYDSTDDLLVGHMTYEE